MDFRKTEAHRSMEALSQKIFRDQVSMTLYHKIDRARTEGFDADLWRVLADAGLLGAIVGEDIRRERFELFRGQYVCLKPRALCWPSCPFGRALWPRRP